MRSRLAVACIALALAGCERSLAPSPSQEPDYEPWPVQPPVPAMGVRTTTWTKANSPYRITGIIVVPEGRTLTIEAGVDIIFERTWPDVTTDSTWVMKYGAGQPDPLPAALEVHGALRAIGTATDSIRFLRTGSLGGGIRFAGADSSALAYARIADVYPAGKRYSTGWGSGIRIDGPSARVSMEHVVLASAGEFAAGLRAADGTRLSLRSCAIAHRHVPDWRIMYEPSTGTKYIGLKLTNVVATLSDSRISGADAGVTINGGTIDMRRCVIVDNGDWRGEHGIDIQGATGTVEGCLIAGKTSFTGSLAVQNCTIVPGDADSGPPPYYAFGAGVTVRNTIIWGATSDFAIDSSASVAWSILQRSPLPTGPGNQNVDPRFVDPAHGDWRLAPGSPAIDAGDPNGPRDLDGTPADIGAPASVVRTQG